MENDLNITFTFSFANGTRKVFPLVLDKTDLSLRSKKAADLPLWVILNYHQCENCPLDASRNEYCPVAVNIAGIVEEFKDFVSHEKARVTVAVEERIYAKDTTVQQGLTPLLGIIMTTTGCPVMEQLKPIKLVDFTGTMEKALLAGEVLIGVIHDSGIWRHLAAKAPLHWVAPKEGVMALEQVYAVTKGTDKKELAYGFVNHMLSAKVQKLMSEELWYSPSSKKVTLSPDHQGRLFATEEKVKQLIQADWKWFNANQEAISMRFNKTFQRA